MKRWIARAAALAAVLSFASSASAQTTVVIAPQPVVVVVEPPPAIVLVEQPPAPAPAPAPAHAPRFILDLRGDALVAAGYDGAALGGSMLAGASFTNGVSAELAVGYASAMGWGPSELQLGVELQRDFSPSDAAGFVLLGRVGTVFLLDDPASRDSGVRLSGQVGVGGRFDLGSDLALTVDLRAVVRYRPDDPAGPNESDLAAGVQTTLGLRVRL